MQVRGAPGKVQILFDGQVVQEYPRNTAARLLIEQACYDPAGILVSNPALAALMSDVVAPAPLGRVGRAIIVAEKSWEAAKRPLSDYEALLRRRQ